MKTRSNASLVVAVLLVGLVNAGAIGWGLSRIAWAVKSQDFDSSFSTGAITTGSSNASDRIVTLSNNTFAVVDNSQISVYQVDTRGNIRRTSDVATYYRSLTPVDRQAVPKPTPSPTPTPNVTSAPTQPTPTLPGQPATR